jgi:hypothetical protein
LIVRGKKSILTLLPKISAIDDSIIIQLQDKSKFSNTPNQTPFPGAAFLASTSLWLLDFATDVEVTIQTASCTIPYQLGKVRIIFIGGTQFYTKFRLPL